MIQIRVDIDRVTLDDVIALEDNKSVRTMRDILARFVTNEAGEYLPLEEAKQVLGKLNMREVKDVASKFADAMKGAAEVPPNGGGRS